MTPTTAAVMPARAPHNGLFLRKLSLHSMAGPRPQHEPDRRHPQGASDGRADVLRQLVTKCALLRGVHVTAAVALADDKSGRTGAGTDKTDHPRSEHDQRERHMAEEDRDE